MATARGELRVRCTVPSVPVPSHKCQCWSTSGLDARTMPATATPADASESRSMAVPRAFRAGCRHGRRRVVTPAAPPTAIPIAVRMLCT
ncbi:hypothetical protein [Oryza sativa Japonica Group]|uniref:Uncharacterized protein n=1 Tax=Oryza sativa subsp. japonica TaxID=39947 RepID=Q5ZAK4_ORYSJ|nr:hypothetical protein [Oryza sativa Japonica Group]